MLNKASPLLLLLPVSGEREGACCMLRRASSMFWFNTLRKAASMAPSFTSLIICLSSALISPASKSSSSLSLASPMRRCVSRSTALSTAAHAPSSSSLAVRAARARISLCPSRSNASRTKPSRTRPLSAVSELAATAVPAADSDSAVWARVLRSFSLSGAKVNNELVEVALHSVGVGEGNAAPLLAKGLLLLLQLVNPHPPVIIEDTTIASKMAGALA
mmetsp:Transcript_36730/g.72751  ORF Transcript_36730/g.72751 Transcript_36730/m.72751 type:complete len:218 (-) Transcript_36730:82-735(-)